MKEQIRAFISEITFIDKETITDDVSLFEQGIFDSMGLLSLITFIDEEMGVKTDDGDLTEENFKSINTIVSFLERKKTPAN
ncbi:acyl carrier protein [Carboxylicivirga sp. M1479]|uniref:acyl carrier protein n=1 Tax=Carboxylicivirga sp. M1479 TaxID=2594476 RepID=UPI001177CC3D|nr:acyl carrier protein [Carboxylicivirga sp. M1479]TRX66345.1 acyl carrier protein [Carboxylicivirga sp. M1479]